MKPSPSRVPVIRSPRTARQNARAAAIAASAREALEAHFSAFTTEDHHDCAMAIIANAVTRVGEGKASFAARLQALTKGMLPLDPEGPNDEIQRVFGGGK